MSRRVDYAFFDAAYQGDLERMRTSIEGGHDVNLLPPVWKSVYQPTALAYAVWGNQPEAVRFLLEHGADPNQPDGDKNYHPIHWASYKSDHAECAQLLVDYGADPAMKTARGFTPLQLAHGLNSNVSSKPGVAAVLEEAARHPRPRWQPHVAHAPAPPTAPPTAPPNPPATRGSTSAARGAAWSPLEAAAAAAAAAAENADAAATLPAGMATAEDWARIVAPDSGSSSEDAASVSSRRRTRSGERTEGAEGARADAGASADAPARPNRSAGRLPSISLTAGAASSSSSPNRATSSPRVSHPVDASSRLLPRAMLAATATVGLSAALAAILLWRNAEVDGATPPLGDSAADENATAAQHAAASRASVQFLIAIVVAVGALSVGLFASWRTRRASQRLGRTASFPPQFLCPITGEVMRDPVTTCDGHAFERVAIERWLKAHRTSPMTGVALETTALTPAIALRQLIERITIPKVE